MQQPKLPRKKIQKQNATSRPQKAVLKPNGVWSTTEKVKKWITDVNLESGIHAFIHHRVKEANDLKGGLQEDDIRDHILQVQEDVHTTLVKCVIILDNEV